MVIVISEAEICGGHVHYNTVFYPGQTSTENGTFFAQVDNNGTFINLTGSPYY